MFKNKEQILKIIESGESKNLQFKEEDVRPESMAKTMVAFSNTYGGTILIGVGDNSEIKGITKTDLEEWVVNISRTNCIPSVEPQVTTVTIEDKQILYVEIPRGELSLEDQKMVDTIFELALPIESLPRLNWQDYFNGRGC